MEQFFADYLLRLTSWGFPRYSVTILLASSMFFSRLIPPKKHFALKASLCAACYILIDYFFIAKLLSIYCNQLVWPVMFVIEVVLAKLCFENKLSDIIFCTACGYAVQNIGSSLEFIVGSFIAHGFWCTFFEHLSSTAVYVIFYLFAARRLEENSQLSVNSSSLYLLCALMLLTVSYLFSYLPHTDRLEAIFSYFIQIAADVILFSLLMTFYDKNKLKEKNENLELLITKDNEKYEAMKSYIDIIDMKCHDFRQLYDSSNKGSAFSAQIAQDIADSVNEYALTPKTGNKALDVVLYDKIMFCKQRHISLTYMVDSNKLSVLSAVDTALIFNNVLNNAIEYVSDLDSDEKKIISMNVGGKNDFLSVHVDNYCESDIRFDYEGLPITTKENKKVHGFGLKSVRYIVKKYNGTMQISVGKTFSINILIPVNP